MRGGRTTLNNLMQCLPENERTPIIRWLCAQAKDLRRKLQNKPKTLAITCSSFCVDDVSKMLESIARFIRNFHCKKIIVPSLHQQVHCSILSYYYRKPFILNTLKLQNWNPNMSLCVYVSLWNCIQFPNCQI